MITAVDTNILLDILLPNETFCDRSGSATPNWRVSLDVRPLMASPGREGCDQWLDAAPFLLRFTPDVVL